MKKKNFLVDIQAKEDLAVEIMRKKMSDKQFNEYSQGFIDLEDLCDKIEDYLRNSADQEELNEFIKKYNK